MKLLTRACAAGGVPFVLFQGSYTTSVGASAGTHSGGGAFDLDIRMMGHAQRLDLINELRLRQLRGVDSYTGVRLQRPTGTHPWHLLDRTGFVSGCASASPFVPRWPQRPGRQRPRPPPETHTQEARLVRHGHKERP